MKLKTVKGFTLAELLIVMAIIVVLAAVAIPTFGKQLETSRETGDMEIIRNAYTEALTYAIQDGADGQLDSKFGAGGTANTSALGAVTFVNTGTSTAPVATYTVSLGDMGGAKFAQSGTLTNGATTGEWTYISNKLMGYVVPAVNTQVTHLTFTFEFDDNGEVAVKTVEVNSTANSLFTPANAVPTVG